jgi:hypothetical protein
MHLLVDIKRVATGSIKYGGYVDLWVIYEYHKEGQRLIFPLRRAIHHHTPHREVACPKSRSFTPVSVRGWTQ